VRANWNNNSVSRWRRSRRGGPSSRFPVAWIPAALAVVGLAGLSSPAPAYEQRSETVSLGLQGGGGLLLSGRDSYRAGDEDYYYGDFTYGEINDVGDVFRFWKLNWGGAFGIRLRYSIDRSHALGVSFEDLRFPREDSRPQDSPSQYQVNNYALDYYTYFSRPARFCPYVVASVGFHRDTFRTGSSENVIAPESFSANLGLGAEYFVRKAWTVDAVARTYYFHGKGGRATALVFHLGFQYYLLR